MNRETGLYLNNLKLVRINYQAGSSVLSLNNPSIEIINGTASFTGTNDYGVRMSIQTPTEKLSLVGTSVAVAQSYRFSAANVNNSILRETYKVTNVRNTDHFINIFYEQPLNQNQNYEKIEAMPSNQTRFFDLDDETVDAFAEALDNNRRAMNNYNSFINKNRNRPNVSNELKNEMPKNAKLQYDHLKEFFKNNKEEIRKILDL